MDPPSEREVSDHVRSRQDRVSRVDGAKGSKTPLDIDTFERAVAESDGDHIEYKTMGWIKAGALIMAETIELGIFTFPSIFHRLGMVAGTFATITFSLLSWQTGYVLIQFKANHPGVMNFADAGTIIAGKPGFWILGVMLIVKSVFVAGSRALSGATALDVISGHPICTVAWSALVTFVAFLLTVPRTFDKLSYISFISVVCIGSACLITIVATGVRSPSLLPGYPSLGHVQWKAFENHGIQDTANALTSIIFAYGGHVAILSFASEMRNPADFKYSLALVQIVATVWYILIGATVYAFGGQYVSSPALIMTSGRVLVTAYSIALVSIIVSGVVASYVAAKFVFLTLFRGTPRLTSRSLHMWAVWVLICATIWSAGWVMAEVIPFFSDLLSFVSSVLTVWFTYGLSGVLWLYDNRPSEKARTDDGRSRYAGYFGGWRTIASFVTSVFVIVMSVVLMVLGAYSAIAEIVHNYSSGSYSHSFSCKP
ncbi:hypothetical protein BV25DRAFT_1801670 [Artomyces pyxidatus]|uniref:Uncharacterized protein n=1 Tax=Artomyces pyxidatus TaxID=48021 RepID=A0ACB8T4R4_9AGAM|nr:hypothetical protein BV25DRAFT_1801670 [Artomyces pyxidatus]